MMGIRVENEVNTRVKAPSCGAEASLLTPVNI